MRKRSVWVEPLFGEAKEFHRLRRFRLRRLLKVNIEGVMVAAGQNLKRLIKHHLGMLFSFLKSTYSRLVPPPLLTFSTAWHSLMHNAGKFSANRQAPSPAAAWQPPFCFWTKLYFFPVISP